MTEKEALVFKIIQNNPFISQQELADQIGLSRPAVANIISSLVRKEYLLGKAYVVNQIGSIVCIGAANVDKKIKSTHALQSYTSNPVTSTTSVGGVARNVAENLGKLGNDVTLVSIAGQDAEWEYIKKMSQTFMNTDGVINVEGCSTGMYTALLDDTGEMYLGLADMSVYDYLTPELLAKQNAVLQHAKCIVIDLNCPQETIAYVCSFAQKHGIRLVLITVSEPKMSRMPKELSAVDCLIVNIGETQAYFNMSIDNEKDAELAIDKWLDLGVKRVVLTAGANRILVGVPEKKWYDVKEVDPQKIIDVTGAGDSFSAAYIDAWCHHESDDDCVLSGMVNAYHTIQSEYTVRQNLTKEQLEKDIEEYKHG